MIQVSDEFGDTKTIDRKTTKLQRKQCRGGASKNRIERLREETVHNYLKLASEKVTRAYTENGIPIIKALLIIGNGNKKDEIREYINIDVPIYVESCDVNDNKELIQAKFFDMVTKEREKEESKYLDRITEIIRTNPDLLIFGKEDILQSIHKLRFLYVAKDDKTEYPIDKSKIIKLNIESYGNFIGELYVSEEN